MRLLTHNIKKHVLFLIASGAIALVLYAGFRYDGWTWFSNQLHEHTHPALILGLFAVLPVVGFPISIFLILLGLRFGPFYGVALMAAVMPIHLLASFGLSHSFLRPWMEMIAAKRRLTIPRVPADRQLGFSFIFMAVPGLPYTMKNYLLALSGVPFRIFFPIGWGVNALLGVPFVILGGAATRWAIILPVALVFMAGGIFGIEQWIKKKINLTAYKNEWTMNIDKGGQ